MLKTCDKKNLSWEILYIPHCFFDKEIILKSLYYKNNKVHFWFYHMRSNRWIWSTIFNKRLFCSFIWIMHKNTNISSKWKRDIFVPINIAWILVRKSWQMSGTKKIKTATVMNLINHFRTGQKIFFMWGTCI